MPGRVIEDRTHEIAGRGVPQRSECLQDLRLDFRVLLQGESSAQAVRRRRSSGSPIASRSALSTAVVPAQSTVFAGGGRSTGW